MSDFASPTLARCDQSFTLSITFLPASRPPRIPKVMMEPNPCVKYFLPSSCEGWSSSPEKFTSLQQGVVVKMQLLFEHYHYDVQCVSVMFPTLVIVKMHYVDSRTLQYLGGV